MAHPLLVSVKSGLNALWLAEVADDPTLFGHVLSLFLEVESNEEARFFHEVAKHVDGPLKRAVLRQAEDEDRHVLLVSRCIDRLGAKPVPVPEELRALPVLAAASGCPIDGTLESRDQLGRGVLMMAVLERRMAERLQLLADAVRERHPAVAHDLDEVAADERRHVKYCRAVGRALLDDDALATALLDEYTAAEARAWPTFAGRVLRHLVCHGARRMGALRRGAWAATAWIASTLGGVEPVRDDLIAERR